MTADKDALLKDALSLLESVAYQHGQHDGFRHIEYCRWCSWARAQPHGKDCIIARITAALEGKADDDQPHGDVRETLEYAKRMGLKTDFPL